MRHVGGEEGGEGLLSGKGHSHEEGHDAHEEGGGLHFE